MNETERMQLSNVGLAMQVVEQIPGSNMVGPIHRGAMLERELALRGLSIVPMPKDAPAPEKAPEAEITPLPVRPSGRIPCWRSIFPWTRR